MGIPELFGDCGRHNRGGRGWQGALAHQRRKRAPPPFQQA
jgi:hypothetical protein